MWNAAQHYAKTFKDNPLGEALFVYGTTAFPEILSSGGALPVDNFRRSKLDDPSGISGDKYNEILLQKRKGCYACPIRCKRGIALEDPKYGLDSRYGGPEYETIAALGSNLNILNLKAIAKGNEICNRYCLDTIGSGMTIAFACECFEKGIISKEDTGGLELRFGDAVFVVVAEHMIGRPAELLEYSLYGLQVRQRPSFHGWVVLVLEVPQLHKKIDVLAVHKSDTLAELLEGLTIEA